MFELGNNLREARMQRRIDIAAAEQDTKIRSKYLIALEGEEFDLLPGPVFVRGFLRTYSRYLGLEPQLFIDEYNARFGRFEELDDMNHTSVLGSPGLAYEHATRGRRAMKTVLTISLIVLALLLWVALRNSPNTQNTSDSRKPVEVSVSPAQGEENLLKNAAIAASGDVEKAAPVKSASHTPSKSTSHK